MDGRDRSSGASGLVVKLLVLRVEGAGFESGEPLFTSNFRETFCTDVHQGTVISTRKE